MRAWPVLLVLSLTLVPLGAADQECRGPDCRPEERDARDRAPERDGLQHIAFEVDRPNATLIDYRVDGRLVLERLALQADGSAPQNISANQRGESLVIRGEGWQVRLHDNPTGLILAEGDVALVFDFPDDVQIKARDEGFAIAYDGYRGVLVARDGNLDGDLINTTGAAKFHIAPPEQADRSNDDVRVEVRERIEIRREAAREKLEIAIEKRHVGAEVRVGAQTEVYKYDEVDVQVTRPASATPDSPLRVLLDAELEAGKTVVIDVDPSLLAGPDLDLRYYDVQDDGNRTEVVFRQADSLEDILDPGNDSGQPEYWVVRDANGIQVLVSVPHWSAHEITIASIGEFLTEPSVLIGVGAGIGGVLVAAFVLLRPRRQIS